jgi:hypothetical protein
VVVLECFGCQCCYPTIACEVITVVNICICAVIGGAIELYEEICVWIRFCSGISLFVMWVIQYANSPRYNALKCSFIHF